ncbi:MAG: hypothetical protein CL773_03660 [Chloroflexi bacterium]|nr:hypothetical protein [Chloroflexota bacterium]
MNQSVIKESLIVIDIGTSSVKTSIFDLEGNILPKFSISIPHTIISKNDGTSEQDPEILRSIVEESIDFVLEKSEGYIGNIVGVGLDSMASTLLGIDKYGKPITPVYTYADTRSNNQVNKIKLDLNETLLHQETGAAQHTSYIPSKIMWIKDNQTNFKDIDKFVDFSTYVYSNWFENKNFKASYSISSWSGLLDRNKLQWHSDLINYLDISEDKLPILRPYDDFEKGLNNNYSKRWKKLSETPFFLSVGDGMAATVGSGCIGRKKIAITVGSTAAIRVLLDTKVDKVPKGLWCYRLLNNYTLLGGSFSEGGNLINWAFNNLKLPKIENLNSDLLKLKSGSHGISVLPFLLGERALGWSNNSKGIITGLKYSNTSIEILQSLLESVSYRLFLVYKMLKDFLHDDVQVIASGGAIKNLPWWIQTTSDVLDKEIYISKDNQDTGKGVAILILKALGQIRNFEDISTEIEEKYSPDKKKHKIHKELIDSHLKLYEKMMNK